MDPDGRRKVQEIEGISPLPVGSQKATEFYAQAALDAGVARVNCRPVLIVRLRRGCVRRSKRNTAGACRGHDHDPPDRSVDRRVRKEQTIRFHEYPYTSIGPVRTKR